MSPAWVALFGWLVASSVAGFWLMGFDKAKARNKGRRIPEATLLTLALVGGAFGILAGSSVFRHKTSKASFMGITLLLAVAWVGLLVGLEKLIGPFSG